MKTMTDRYLGIMLIALLGLSSCYELQSDEELREDIIGTWTREICEYPNSMEDDNVTVSSPLQAYLTFYSDGRYTEGGETAYCTLDSCDTVDISSYCRCTWAIENGRLTIITDGSSVVHWLNREFPIKCLDDDNMVFDNIVINGITQKKACYVRN